MDKKQEYIDPLFVDKVDFNLKDAIQKIKDEENNKDIKIKRIIVNRNQVGNQLRLEKLDKDEEED